MIGRSVLMRAHEELMAFPRSSGDVEYVWQNDPGCFCGDATAIARSESAGIGEVLTGFP